MKISEIIIKERIRKEMGDLVSLEKSIHKLGLLHPIVISGNNELIAGKRRIEACINLEWEDIPVTVVKLENNKSAELDENTERKDFTISETRAIYDYVKENTLKQGEKEKAGVPPALFTGDVRNNVAKITGKGIKQIDQIVTITDAAVNDPEIAEKLKELDATKPSVKVQTVHAKVERKKKVDTQEKLELPEGQYQIIYTDPPWTYGNYAEAGLGKNSAEKYTTMTIDELKELKVEDLAAKDSVMLMWVTFPQLKDSIEVMESWGFEYRTTAFVWVKKNKNADSYFFGLGEYTRANAEICLLGVKGKGLTVKSKSVRQICDAVISEHSEKPAEIRNRIVELFGDVKRIEMFARKTTPGWETWGNEI